MTSPELSPILVMGVLLLSVLALLTVIVWLCGTDTIRRGKSPFLVAILVIFFFPAGLIAWLVFRPKPIDEGNHRQFRLDDHRIQ